MEHPRLIHPSNKAIYNSEKMEKTTLFQSEQMLVGLNAFKEGQEHKIHAHNGMDKMYHVLEGSGLVLLEGKEISMKAGNILIAPSGVPHGIRNTGNENLLVLAVLAPSP